MFSILTSRCHVAWGLLDSIPLNSCPEQSLNKIKLSELEKVWKLVLLSSYEIDTFP